MRAALYARFSSDNQREESITAQLRASKTYCKQHNYTVVKVYTDEAKSGTSVVGREAFQQMMLDSMDDVFDVVVFHKIDRAARNEIDYYANMSRLERNGIRYEYSAEGIDTSTINGKLTEGIKVAVAAWYSRNLSAEVKKGKKETALQCKFNGGIPPLGYDIVDGKYVINEHEAEAVRAIYDMKLHGKGYGEMIFWLQAHGYKTKRGGEFGKNSLFDILRNKRYTGTFQYAKGTKHNSHTFNADAIEIEDGMPRIIDDYTWDKVQALKRKKKNGANNARTTYALSGKLRCECGATMTGQASTKGIHKYYHYACRNKYYKKLPCNVPRLKKDHIERLVLNYIIQDIKQDKDKILEEFKTINDNNNIAEKKKALAQQIAKQEQKVERLLNLYATDGDDLVVRQYRQAKSELALLKKERSELKGENGVDLAEVETFLDQMVGMDFNESDMKEIFDLLVEEIIVHPATIEIKLTIRLSHSVVALTRYHPLYNCA